MKPKNEKQPKTWRKVKLGEVLELKYGFGLPETKRKTGRVPVFGSSGIVGAHNEAAVQSQGIVIGRKGHVGSIHYSNVPFYPIDTVYYVDQLKIPGDIKFFYYFLKRMPFQQIGSDVGVPGLNRDIAYSLEVKIPEDPNIQKRIADILSAFDDKIELNNKINQTLEQMAQAIFKEWFVSPSIALAEEDKLPKGWRVGKLGELMVARKEKFRKYEEWKNLKLLDLGRFPQKSLAITSYGKGEEIKTAGIGFKKGDVLFGAVRPYFHKVVIAPFDGVTNSSVFVITPKKESSYAFLVTVLFSENTVNYASMSASGTKMPVIKWEDLCDMEVLIPEERAIENFNKTVKNFYNLIIKNTLENQKLASLRDLLLPKLMSGKILVKS